MVHTLFGDGVQFFNIAHRGFSKVAPENTISSFERAVKAGANMIEMDVKLTGDGHVIVFHDSRLGRTTDGSGLVGKLPASHIRSFDAGTWFGESFRGERVPFLEEVLEIARGRVRLDIEIKHRRKSDVGVLVEKCTGIVERHRMTEDVLFTSFNLEALRILHSGKPHLRFAPLYRHNLKPTRRSFPLRYGAQAVVVNHRFLNRASVGKFHDAGLKVFVYTVNGPRRILKMIDMGVDGIISDNPAAVSAAAGRTRT